MVDRILKWHNRRGRTAKVKYFFSDYEGLNGFLGGDTAVSRLTKFNKNYFFFFSPNEHNVTQSYNNEVNKKKKKIVGTHSYKNWKIFFADKTY